MLHDIIVPGILEVGHVGAFSYVWQLFSIYELCFDCLRVSAKPHFG